MVVIDDILKQICVLKEDKTRIGFNSEEFLMINSSDNFSKIVDDSSIEKIKDKIEGVCIGDGYVIPGSVKILERSDITFPLESLQLYYSLTVHYSYLLCNPNAGVVLLCKIITKNKIGVLGKLEDPLSPLVILIPEDLCNTKFKVDLIRNSSTNDTIKVVVVGKKFEQNDKKITVIAEIFE